MSTLLDCQNEIICILTLSPVAYAAISSSSIFQTSFIYNACFFLLRNGKHAGALLFIRDKYEFAQIIKYTAQEQRLFSAGCALDFFTVTRLFTQKDKFAFFMFILQYQGGESIHTVGSFILHVCIHGK